MDPDPMLSSKPTGGRAARVLGDEEVEALVAMREQEEEEKKKKEEDEEQS